MVSKLTFHSVWQNWTAEIYENALKAGCAIVEDIHLNPNSQRTEFSIRDPDWYFLTITEFHNYKGNPTAKD